MGRISARWLLPRGRRAMATARSVGDRPRRGQPDVGSAIDAGPDPPASGPSTGTPGARVGDLSAARWHARGNVRVQPRGYRPASGGRPEPDGSADGDRSPRRWVDPRLHHHGSLGPDGTPPRARSVRGSHHRRRRLVAVLGRPPFRRDPIRRGPIRRGPIRRGPISRPVAAAEPFEFPSRRAGGRGARPPRRAPRPAGRGGSRHGPR